MRSTPQLGGLFDKITGAVSSVVKTVTPYALAPVYLPTKLSVAAATGLVSAATPVLKSAASAAGSAAATAAGAAHTVLSSAGQAIQQVKGGGAVAPPPEPSNLPIILAGVAAAGILGFALFGGHHRASS